MYCHILPSMDDGSPNVQAFCSVLYQQIEQKMKVAYRHLPYIHRSIATLKISKYVGLERLYIQSIRTLVQSVPITERSNFLNCKFHVVLAYGERCCISLTSVLLTVV